MGQHKIITRIVDNIEEVIKGKRTTIEDAVAVFLAGGHLLIEDLPGLGKTMLARALARTLELTFKRIQFTPDLLPSDITGSMIYNQKEQEFKFARGPVFANILLADEINRATPRTQSAMLECMGEQRVTIDGVDHPLPPPFLVIATQNPVETQGTFPLPVAELDRFMARIAIGYPDKMSERAVLTSQEMVHPIDKLEPVVSAKELGLLQQEVLGIHLADELKDYIIRITSATRQSDELRIGASPRGSLDLMKLARSRAYIDGRDFVTPDDIKAIAVPALAHRLLPRTVSAGRSPGKIIADLLLDIPAPA